MFIPKPCPIITGITGRPFHEKCSEVFCKNLVEFNSYYQKGTIKFCSWECKEWYELYLTRGPHSE